MGKKVGKTNSWKWITGTSVSTAISCARTPTRCGGTANKLTARTAAMSAASAKRLSSEPHTSRSDLPASCHLCLSSNCDAYRDMEYIVKGKR